MMSEFLLAISLIIIVNINNILKATGQGKMKQKYFLKVKHIAKVFFVQTCKWQQHTLGITVLALATLVDAS
jgi:hypothetical protein